MAATRERVLSLYKSILRESQKFKSYSYRTYALRRTKDAFQEHKSETDSYKIEELLKIAQKRLEMIKRQTTISNMYEKTKIVIESQ